jgi:hypothetical protein
MSNLWQGRPPTILPAGDFSVTFAILLGEVPFREGYGESDLAAASSGRTAAT